MCVCVGEMTIQDGGELLSLGGLLLQAKRPCLHPLPAPWRGGPPQPQKEKRMRNPSFSLLAFTDSPRGGGFLRQVQGTLAANSPQWKIPVHGSCWWPKAYGPGSRSSCQRCEDSPPLSGDYEDQLEGRRFELKSAKNHSRAGESDCLVFKKDIGRSPENRLLDFLFCAM